MDTKVTATLLDGSKVGGRLTTDHPASSYGQPVFVDSNNQAIDWLNIVNVQTTEASSKGGQATSPAKTAANRAKANLPPKLGKKPRGRPRKSAE
jgi:hypothetical protein